MVVDNRQPNAAATPSDGKPWRDIFWGAALGAFIGLIFALVFAVPQLGIRREPGFPAWYEIALVYFAGFTVVGAIVGTVKQVFLRHWALAGLVGTIAAIPLIAGIAVISLEGDLHLLPEVVAILGPSFGFPCGVAARWAILS